MYIASQPRNVTVERNRNRWKSIERIETKCQKQKTRHFAIPDSFPTVIKGQRLSEKQSYKDGL